MWNIISFRKVVGDVVLIILVIGIFFGNINCFFYFRGERWCFCCVFKVRLWLVNICFKINLVESLDEDGNFFLFRVLCDLGVKGVS